MHNRWVNVVATIGGIDLEQIRKLASSGHSDKFIAEFFGVSPASFSEWKRKNPEFKAALKNWRDEADEQVERALFLSAVGQVVTDVRHYKDKKTGVMIPVEDVKHYVGDVSAQKHWLAKRKPQEWGDAPAPKNPLEGLFNGATIAMPQVELDERIRQIVFGRALEDALL